MNQGIKRRARLLAKVVCAAGIFAGGIWGGVEVGRDILFWWRMHHAVEVPGRLLSMTDIGNDSVIPAVSYRYDFRGQAFTGNRAVVHEDEYNVYSYPRSEFAWDLRQRLRDIYEKGSEVTVYINPNVPSMSTLDRSFHLYGVLGPLCFFLLGIPLGLIGAFSVFEEVGKNRGEAGEETEQAEGVLDNPRARSKAPRFLIGFMILSLVSVAIMALWGFLPLVILVILMAVGGKVVSSRLRRRKAK